MNISEALQIAIEGEIEGREFYRMLARKTEDKKAKRVFMDLSADEDMHLHFLRGLHKTLTGKEGKLPELPRIREIDDPESPIFTREFKELVKKEELSALSKGMKLELESVEFYKKMARETDDEKLKELFKYLAEWEMSHYEMLRKQVSFFEEFLKGKNPMFRGF